MKSFIRAVSVSALLVCCWAAFARSAPKVEGKNIRIEFNGSLHSRVVAKFDGKDMPVGPFAATEFVTASGKDVEDFSVRSVKREAVRDRFGSGRRTVIRGTAPSLEKTVVVTVYDAFPRTAFFEVRYTNTGNADLAVRGWTNQHYTIAARSRALGGARSGVRGGAQGGGLAAAPGAGKAEEPAFWSYQSGSYRNRPNWVLPLQVNFRQENFMGMNSTDYGGGTPVVDVWRRDVGIAVGGIELAPKLVSLPVTMPDAQSATVAVHFKRDATLRPGATLQTFRTFVTVHQGDYFQALRDYSRVMQKQGFVFHPAPDSAYEPIWCAWGFGKRFTPGQVVNALPIVKKLGFDWVTVDYGWEDAEGDWFLDKNKFPNGDRDMKALVDRIHAEGFKAQLWWSPMAASPESELVREHPDELLLNADGSKEKITFWNDWYLCPADPRVVEMHRRLVKKILGDWGYDGLKLDGMHMNGAPPCYNPAHHHARPEESVEAVPKLFQVIYDTARSVKPDALVEFCPCGTAFSLYTLPYMNMSVASDPRGSFQVRSKGKTLKALHGDTTAYFGDHVELSDGRSDFASTVGVGGVVGSNFTWPVGTAERTRGDLTPEKEAIWAKWVRIYKQKMLSRGEYLGTLYDIGFDRPEAHAIRKGSSMYYAFYAPDWSGKVELRGLAGGSYRVTDYENGKDLGTVRGPTASLDVQFEKHLLLEARPE